MFEGRKARLFDFVNSIIYKQDPTLEETLLASRIQNVLIGMHAAGACEQYLNNFITKLEVEAFPHRVLNGEPTVSVEA